MFAYSSSGYTNCQLTRQEYNYISRSDKIKDAKWDIYELRYRGGGNDNIHFPSNNGKRFLWFFRIVNDTFSVCFEKLKTGYRHYSGFYKDHFNVRDVEECKGECARTPDCRSFSYR